MSSGTSKTPVLLKTTPHLETQPILPLATTPHDWIQIKLECDDIKNIRRVFVIFSGITLYNLHRIIHYSASYEDNLGIEHNFLIKNQKYGSGVGDNMKRMSDRKVRLMQVIQNTGETFQYVYGLLKCSLVVIATKNGTKEKLSWLPRICSGSVGTFPPEISCSDLQQISRYTPFRFINIDTINKIYMHERFGANQITNKNEKRMGPSILCQSTQPHSTISLIFKRPIVSLYDSGDDTEDEEEEKEKENRSMKIHVYRKRTEPKQKIPYSQITPLKGSLEKKTPFSPSNSPSSFIISLLSPKQ
jgi:hypothetical protein